MWKCTTMTTFSKKSRLVIPHNRKEIISSWSCYCMSNKNLYGNSTNPCKIQLFWLVDLKMYHKSMYGGPNKVRGMGKMFENWKRPPLVFWTLEYVSECVLTTSQNLFEFQNVGGREGSGTLTIYFRVKI